MLKEETERLFPIKDYSFVRKGQRVKMKDMKKCFLVLGIIKYSFRGGLCEVQLVHPRDIRKRKEVVGKDFMGSGSSTQLLATNNRELEGRGGE